MYVCTYEDACVCMYVYPLSEVVPQSAYCSLSYNHTINLILVYHYNNYCIHIIAKYRKNSVLYSEVLYILYASWYIFSR